MSDGLRERRCALHSWLDTLGWRVLSGDAELRNAHCIWRSLHMAQPAGRIWRKCNMIHVPPPRFAPFVRLEVEAGMPDELIELLTQVCMHPLF